MPGTFLALNHQGHMPTDVVNRVFQRVGCTLAMVGQLLGTAQAGKNYCHLKDLGT